MSREFKITLTEDDLFQLKLMKDRADMQMRNVRKVPAYFNVHSTVDLYTDDAREAMHDLDCLNHILQQV